MNLRTLLVTTSLLGTLPLSLAAQKPAGKKGQPKATTPAESSVAEASDVLGAMAWVPKGSSVVILVNHPARTLDALTQLAGRMKFKGASLTRQTLVDDFGGEPLFDDQSSLVEFTYPLKGEENEAKSSTVQMRIMRVPVIGAFTSRFKPKAIPGGFFELTVAKKPCVAAFRGGYAILAPKEHLGALKDALQEREVFSMLPASQRGWVLDEDVAMIFPAAVLKEKPAATEKKTPKQDTVFSPVEAMMEGVRKNPEAEVSHVAIGARTEEAGGISFEARIGFKEGGKAAEAITRLQGTLADVAGAVSKGLPTSPYALAFTGMVPSGYASWLASSFASAEVKSTPERDAKLAMMQESLRGLKSFGFIWAMNPSAAGPGKPLQGALLTLQVEDAEAALKTFAAYAKANPSEGGAALPEVSEFKGHTLLKLQVPAPKASTPAEGEAPKASPINPSAIFGKDPLPTLAWAYDAHTVLVGFGEAEQAFGPSILAIEQPEKSLGRQPAFALTQDMLGGEQQMQIFINLQGLLTAIGTLFPVPIQLPDSAKDAPPLGFGIALGNGGLSVKAVAPAETVELVGNIVESAMKISEDAKKAKGEAAPAETADPSAEPAPETPLPAKGKKASKKKG